MTTSLTARRVRAGGACAPRHLPCLILLATLTGVAHAAADPAELQTIVISATRIPTPMLEVASSMTVITAAEIEARQQRPFADVLKEVPGLNVVQPGRPGAVTSASHARHQLQPHQGAARWHRSVGPE
jgi:outer membrane receptor protein involved in Fe transport